MVSRRVGKVDHKVDLRRVAEFGDEVRAVGNAFATHATFTERTPERLNHLLRHPSGSLEGYLILDGSTVRGFAVLNFLAQGRARIGRIVECFLDGESIGSWSSAVAAIVAVIADRGVDAIFGCGSTPWSAEAYHERGFVEAFPLESRLRDLTGLVPRAGPFHLTFLEADYSYLP